MYLMNRAVVAKGSLAGILGAGLLSGLVLGGAVFGAAYAITAGGGYNPPSTLGIPGMAGTGLVLAMVLRYVLSRNKVFNLQQSADAGTSIPIGFDWVVALLLSPAYVSLVMPEVARILWRIPMAFLPVGAVAYFLWLLMFRPLAKAFSGMRTRDLVIAMASISLEEEMGMLAGYVKVDYDNGVLRLTGGMRSRDHIKEARQAVLGLPYVSEVDSDGLRLERV